MFNCRSNNPGWESYIEILDTLKDNGKTIDYNTLMHTYQAMVQTQHEIPHIDSLLVSLINKRNDNPRIDQMVLNICRQSTGQQ